MAGRRGNGEGYIFKEGNYWRGQIAIGRDDSGKMKRANVKGDTRAEVQAQLAKLRTQANEGEITEITNITCTQWFDTWLSEYKKGYVADKTYESYKYLITQHIKPAIGKTKLKNLRPDQLQKLVNTSISKDLAPRTVRYIITVVHACLEQAVRNGMLAKNVSDAVVLPPMERKREMKVLSQDDQMALVKACEGERLGSVYILCLATGVRIGECLALTWDNVNLDEGYIKIRQSLKNVKKEVDGVERYVNEIGKTKTKSSIRDIPLPNSIIKRLRTHRIDQMMERLEAGENYADNNLVFATMEGKLLLYRNVCKVFKHMLKNAGLSVINLHALRHSFATRLLEENEHPKVVQELLGHSSIQMTLDIYSHVTPDIAKKATAKLDKWFAVG